jgi:hypothetical protein
VLNLKLMDKETVNRLLNEAEFRFAKSMPKFPHWYTLRETWKNDSDFVDVVLFIRQNGVKKNFWKRSYIYYSANGYQYWTMGNPISYEDKTKTILINRAKE